MARATRDEWSKRVEEWRRSGLSGDEYALRVGVRANTLKHWKWRLGREHAAVPRTQDEAKSVSFVEVVPGGRAGTGIEVMLPSGVLVRVAADFDDDALRRVVAIVGGH